MPFIYQTLTVKPEGEKWYPEIEPIKHASYMKWFESYPGLVNVKNSRPSENEHLRIAKFANKEAYDSFVAERNQRADYIERQQWLDTHGFTVTSETNQID